MPIRRLFRLSWARKDCRIAQRRNGLAKVAIFGVGGGSLFRVVHSYVKCYPICQGQQWQSQLTDMPCNFEDLIKLEGLVVGVEPTKTSNDRLMSEFYVPPTYSGSALISTFLGTGKKYSLMHSSGATLDYLEPRSATFRGSYAKSCFVLPSFRLRLTSNLNFLLILKAAHALNLASVRRAALNLKQLDFLPIIEYLCSTRWVSGTIRNLP